MRARILEIFEEDEKAIQKELEEQEKAARERLRQRKNGSMPDLINTTTTHPASVRQESKSDESENTDLTDLGSDDLQSRKSLEYIDVNSPTDNKVIIVHEKNYLFFKIMY